MSCILCCSERHVTVYSVHLVCYTYSCMYITHWYTHTHVYMHTDIEVPVTSASSYHHPENWWQNGVHMLPICWHIYILAYVHWLQPGVMNNRISASLHCLAHHVSLSFPQSNHWAMATLYHYQCGVIVVWGCPQDLSHITAVHSICLPYTHHSTIAMATYYWSESICGTMLNYGVHEYVCNHIMHTQDYNAGPFDVRRATCIGIPRGSGWPNKLHNWLLVWWAGM